jgi:hypothetical protein
MAIDFYAAENGNAAESLNKAKSLKQIQIQLAINCELRD